MNFRKTVLALSVLGAVGMSGCGGSSHDHPVLTSASGEAIDGYLQGAIACFDTNGDKSCDGEASSTITDINGEFSISGTGAAGAVILIESTATTTESNTKGATGSLAGEFTLTAIQGTGVAIVSPFTTMIQVGVEHGVYASAAAGEAEVVAALGLPEGTDIDTYDFIEEGNASVIATAEAVTEVIIANTAEVQQISDDAGATYGDETVYESAILELIDTDGADTESDFETLADVIDDDPSDTAAIATAVTTASVDSTADAADVNESLGDVNESNAEETGGGDGGTGGTGGTGAV